MKVRYLSDIHFEFQDDGGRAFVGSLPTDCDVLVLAGDIGVAHGGSLLRGMHLLLERFAGVPVLYVPGNHEFYGDDRGRYFESSERARRKAQEKVRKVCDRLTTEHANFVGGVDPWTWEKKGVRFVGATLWFGRPDDSAPKHGMTDYRVIPGLEVWEPSESARHLAYLGNHVDARTVVVTHHLPCTEVLDSKWRGSPLNAFFVHPSARRIIDEQKPIAWIHGHSHEPLRARVGSTTLLRNPYGYAPNDLVGGFSRFEQFDIDTNAPEALR